MNDDRKEHDYPVTIDQKLVAHLLGEADAATSAEVEAALAEDAALRTRSEELQAALGLLRTPEFAPALDTQRREELRAAAAGASGGSAPQAGKVHRFPLMRVAAALMVFGAAVALWKQPWQGDRDPGRYDAVAPESSAAHGDDASGDGYGQRLGEGSADLPEAKGGRAGDGLSSLGYAEEADEDSVVRDKVTAGNEAGTVSREADAGPAAEAESLSLEAARAEPSERFDEVYGLGGVGGGAGGPVSAQPVPNADIGLVMVPESQPQGGLIAGAPPSAPSAPRVPSTPNMPPAESGKPASGYAYAGPGDSTPPAAGSEVAERSRRFRAEQGDQEVDARNRFSREDSRDVAGALQGLGAGSAGRLDPIRKSRPDFYWALEETADLRVRRPAVIDGYGRGYYDEGLIDYLHPRCEDCRAPQPQRGKCRHHEAPKDMFFRFYGDNAVERTDNNALSTFAADVDTASYPLVRNYLVNGSLPPKSAIRTEEFVNYFKLGLAPPAEGDFAVHLDAVPSRFSKTPRMLVRAGIQAREVTREDRKPLNLVFVIDKSGSMAKQDRIELVKRSLELLVDQLRDDDTVGIVTFDSEGHEVLAPTPGHLRWEIREAVRGLGTGGSTNAEAGLKLGYAMVERAQREGAVNRVVLASDGVANTGETDQERILADVQAHAEARIDLTTIGVGMGNHNDVFLEQLADQGDGSCHYVDDFAEAKRVLVDGFTGVMQVVARDVKIQLEFDGEVVEGWRQLGYENRSLTAEQFRDDSVDAGEVGAGHSVAALYELDLAQGAGAEAKLVTLRLRWFPDGASEAVEEEHVLKLGEARTKWGLAEPRLRLSAVAAQYAEVLRRSYHAREDGYQDLVKESEALARELGDDVSVVELRDMIQRTESLARWQPLDDPLARLVDEARQARLQEARLAQLEQDERTQKLLEEIRSQNERIEQEIRDLIQQR